MIKEILRMEYIETYLGERKILDNAKLNLFEKEIVGIVGVNDSAKSILIGAINGFYPKTSGKIYYNEELIEINSVSQARKNGIFYIQQKSSLIDSLTVAENIYLVRKNSFGFFGKTKKTKENAKKLLELMELNVTHNTYVENLDHYSKIIVEICKSIVNDCKILIFDSVMAGLTVNKMKKMKKILSILVSLDISIIMVENRQAFLQPLCNRIFIIRNGGTVAILENDKMKDDNTVISHMIGYDLHGESFVENCSITSDYVLLSLKNVSYKNLLKDFNLSVYKKEIIGILDVNRNSCEALEIILSGVKSGVKGAISFENKEITLKTPYDSLKYGISVVPEDDALFEDLTIGENIVFSSLRKNSNKFGIINKSEIKYLENEIISTYVSPNYENIKKDNPLPIGCLLRKKIAIWKALATEPKNIGINKSNAKN